MQPTLPPGVTANRLTASPGFEIASSAARGPGPVLALGGITALWLASAVTSALQRQRVIVRNEELVRVQQLDRALAGLNAAFAQAQASAGAYWITTNRRTLEPFRHATEEWRLLNETLRQQRLVRRKDVESLERACVHASVELERALTDASPRSFDLSSLKTARDITVHLRGWADRRGAALRAQAACDTGMSGVVAFVAAVTAGSLAGLLLRWRSTRAFQSARTPSRTIAATNPKVDRRAAELAELSRHLIRVAEEEKAKLARELHDTLGSNLTAINMDLNWIAKRLPPDRPELRERLQRALQMLGKTVELKHEVIDGLRPTHLDNLGLAFAIRAHCQEFTRHTGLPCAVEMLEEFDDLDPAWSIALYRVVQEALTNVAKHAQATRVEVELLREEDGLRLRIRDDGVGLGSMTGRASHGLIGMRERMELIGGALKVSRTGARGTLVDAFIPMPESTSADASRAVER